MPKRKIKTDDLKTALARLRLMKFSPLADPETGAALMEELARMCPDVDALDWLVTRTLQLYTEWPGVRELRAVLCARYRPTDGVEVYSSIYLEGIPSEHPPQEWQPKLSPGRYSADPELDAAVKDLALKKSLPAPGRKSAA